MTVESRQEPAAAKTIHPSPARQGKWARVHSELLRKYAGADPDTALPSETQLCEEYGVSRITVRRALDELARTGVVRREQGRGTFATGGRDVGQAVDRFDLSGFYAQRVAEGQRVSSAVILQTMIAAPNEMALALGSREGEPAIRLDRLRSVDGTIDHVNRIWVLGRRFPLALHHDFEHGSFYEFLRETYGVLMCEDRVQVSLVQPTGDEMALMGIEDADMRLHTSSTVYDAEGQPIIHGRTTFAKKTAMVGFTALAATGPRAGHALHH